MYFDNFDTHFWVEWLCQTHLNFLFKKIIIDEREISPEATEMWNRDNEIDSTHTQQFFTKNSTFSEMKCIFGGALKHSKK